MALASESGLYCGFASGPGNGTDEHPTRKWRNWQTHQLEGLAVAIPWRFESSLPHQLIRLRLIRWAEERLRRSAIALRARPSGASPLFHADSSRLRLDSLGGRGPQALGPSGYHRSMKLLAGYLADYWKLVALSLVLAAINQVFSLLDPLIFRHVIDEYATRFREYSTGEFFRGVSVLLAAAVGVAFVSRVAKNFQDYFINVTTQRLGARLYSDGIRHSLELPYSVFEDQRSGETLGKLQKVRSDVEKLVSASINVLFTSLVGIIFVMVYAVSVHWIIAPAYFLTVPLLGVLSSVLSRKIKVIQKAIVAETTAL